MSGIIIPCNVNAKHYSRIISSPLHKAANAHKTINIIVLTTVYWLIGLSQYAQKFVQNAFGKFPKFLPIMLFMFPIMLVLCSDMNNIDVKTLLLK